MGWVAAIALATLLELSCGQVYRPVVIPTNTTPPNPANFHAVFGISSNVAFNPGTALQIDVSGDTNIGVANMGVNPTHAAISPNHTRVFVASAGSLFLGGSDIITAFSPAASGFNGLGTPTTFTLPNIGANQSAGIVSISEVGNVVTMILVAPLLNAKVGNVIAVSGVVIPNAPVLTAAGYDGSFSISSLNGTTIQYTNPNFSDLSATSGGTATIPVPLFCSYLPDFLATSQTNAMYVANYGVENGADCNLSSTDSVASLNLSQNTVGTIAYLPPGSHPVAMAETPNGQGLYVANQGNNTVVDLSPIDLSTMATISVDSPPVWMVARGDNQRVYALTQGDGALIPGKLVPIDAASNTILPSQTNLSVGMGANFILYDSSLNRLYVTNPTTGTVFVFSVTGGVDLGGTPNDTPRLLATIPMSGGANPPCPAGCSPVSVAALPDGSRIYVASYVAQPACSDPNIGSGSACMIPLLSVFDALSLTVKPVSSSVFAKTPSMSLLTTPQFTRTQFAVSEVPSCVAAPHLHTGFDPLSNVYYGCRGQQSRVCEHLRRCLNRRHRHYDQHDFRRGKLSRYSGGEHSSTIWRMRSDDLQHGRHHHLILDRFKCRYVSSREWIHSRTEGLDLRADLRGWKSSEWANVIGVGERPVGNTVRSKHYLCPQRYLPRRFQHQRFRQGGSAASTASTNLLADRSIGSWKP